MFKKFKFIFFFVVIFLLLSPVIVFAANYELDPVYTNVMFKIRHLTGYNLGTFTRFKGGFELGDDNQLKGIVANIDVKSIDTRSAARDQDLLSERFFDAEKFPQAVFVGKEIKDGKLIGDLTLKGVTKSVVFDLAVGAPMKDQYGRTKAGVSAQAKINRKDFGINFNQKLDRGQMLLGDEVEIIIEAQGLRVK